MTDTPMGPLSLSWWDGGGWLGLERELDVVDFDEGGGDKVGSCVEG